MLRPTFLLLSFIALLFSCQNATTPDSAVPNDSAKVDSLTIGAIHTLNSKVLHEARELVVSLPEGYENSDASYPVLYLTDGFQNIEHVQGSVELLTRTGHIPPIIIVGIKSVDRVRDFTYTASENAPNSGGGAQFLAFIESELIPHIDSTYRTKDFKVLEGHSLGGLFAATTLMEKPELFHGYIVMSPALWWNGEELTQKAGSFFAANQDLDKTVFFGIGKEESNPDFGMRKELTNFIDALQANKPENIGIGHKEFEGEGHMSSTLLSNYHGLRHTFGDLKYSEEFVANFTDEAFLQKEAELIAKYGERAKRTGESYYTLGAALYQQNLPGAITVFKRSVAVYPFDMNLIVTLARLYEKNDQIAEAIATYEMAINVSEENNYGQEEGYQKEIERLKNN